MSVDVVFVHMGGQIWGQGNPDSTAPHELPGWYFWDETWAFYHGPFATKEEANAALNVYCKECL